MILLDGKTIADAMLRKLKTKFSELGARRPPKLVAVLVGDNPASIAFLRQKEKAALEAGVAFELNAFPATISTAALRRAIVDIGRHKTVSAMIVQLPLPGRISQQPILNAVPPGKDIDALCEQNTAKFVLGRLPFDPPPVAAIKELFARYEIGLAQKHVVLVGQGRLIGKPLAWWLMNEEATLTAASRNTPDLGALTRLADVIITGVGMPRLITGDMVKQGAVLCDFGFTKEGDAIVGDIDAESVAAKAGALTPVPGGLGPLTVAMLFGNMHHMVKNQNANNAITV